MATVSDPDADPPSGVEFIHEDDGRVTARHVESGVASFGDTEAEALRYENPDTDEVRTVTVPKADPIPTGTLHDSADQAGAEDFHSFCEWVDRTA